MGRPGRDQENPARVPGFKKLHGVLELPGIRVRVRKIILDRH